MCWVAGLNSLGCDASQAGKAQQGMRQVIHKLQLLHRVWQNVLPRGVYIKAISEFQGLPEREERMSDGMCQLFPCFVISNLYSLNYVIIAKLFQIVCLGV